MLRAVWLSALQLDRQTAVLLHHNLFLKHYHSCFEHNPAQQQQQQRTCRI
jgi:hypothetical protein